MPSVRQIGGVSGKSFRRYTINEKLVFIRLLGELCHSGTSKANAARALNIPLSTIEKWMKEGTILQLHAAPQKALKSGHPGPNHQLDAFKDEILNWIFEHREQGVCITVNAVVVHACSLSHEFAIKTWKVKARSVSRFLKKWGYVHRLGTHKSQRDPSLVQDEAREWMAMIVPTLVGPERDPNFISTWTRLLLSLRILQKVLSKRQVPRPSPSLPLMLTRGDALQLSPSLHPVFNFQTWSSSVVRRLGESQEQSLPHILLVPCMPHRRRHGWMRDVWKY